MKITVGDFENIESKLSLLISCTSNLYTRWSLKYDRVLTCDVEYSTHEDQNSLDDNLCKSDVQVDICLKLLLIKSNPVVFLLSPKG